MDKRILSGIVAIAIVASMAFGFAMNSTGVNGVNVAGTLNSNNTVVIQVDKMGGEHLTYVVHPNTMTIIGESATENMLSTGYVTGTTVVQMKYISLGTTPSPADNTAVILASELTGGVGRATGTVTAPVSPTWNTYSVSNKFTANATTTENCAGLHWSAAASSSGNLWAYASFTPVTTNSGDNITITWTVTFTPGG